MYLPLTFYFKSTFFFWWRVGKRKGRGEQRQNTHTDSTLIYLLPKKATIPPTENRNRWHDTLNQKIISTL